MPRSIVETKIIDTNLFFGSPDRIRDLVGGFYALSDSKLGPTTVSTVATNTNNGTPTFEIASDGRIRGTNSDIHLSNYFVFSRVSTIDPKFLNDQYWRNYAVENFTINSTFFDHTTQITLPVTRDDELINSRRFAASRLTYVKPEYYQFYERYQNNLSNVASEHLLPNYYFLKSQGIADLDIAKMITLEGTIAEDYFDYVSFVDELIAEQPILLALSAVAAGRLGGTTEEIFQNLINFLFGTEVSDPASTSQINTLFSNVASDKDVPRYSYNNIKKYLNVDYVNHTYSATTAQRLQIRLQNIIFLEPSILADLNDNKIATDFSFLRNDKKQAVYSLMPMSNHIRIDKRITEKTNDKFAAVIRDSNYQGKLLKTLKEAFLNEISLKPVLRPFVVDRVIASQTELKTLDMIEMLVYNYNNYLSETSNCFFFDLATDEQKKVFDSIGEYRFENSERSGDVLNHSVEEINKIFTSLNMDVLITRDAVEMLNLSNTDKYTETIAFRVEKIGGPPTGDSRTENVLQNFWFYNTGELIEYIDSQVKYGTDYTYKTYAYVIVVGNKYQYTDLRLTRQIDIQETETDYGTATNYCLEFYDPTTGETVSQLFEGQTNLANELDVAFGRSQRAFDAIAEYIRNRLDEEIIIRVDAIDYSSITTNVTYAGLTILEAIQKAVTIGDMMTANALVSFLGQEVSRITGEANQDFLPFVENLKEAFGAFENILATNAQITSAFPYLADFKLTVEPSAKIVEVPIQEKTFKILDNPPNDLIATPHHLKDQSNRLSFFLSYDTFSPNTVPYPVALTAQDDQNKIDYIAGLEISEDDFMQDESVSMAETFEVYRLSRKPTSYQDFEDNLRQSIDLRILKNDKIKLDALFTERVRPNQKYYYTFRAINENGIAGEFTPIFESELINDGGYVYGNFNQLMAEDLVTDNISEPLMSFKKLFNVVPNIQHLLLQSNDADFSDSAFSQVENFSLGAEDNEDKIWGKTFKLRLTSKKTGKKIDLNIKFNDSKG